jgi:ribonuclease HII
VATRRRYGLAEIEGLRAGLVVCGIDEAGRGPLAGPVAAAAVILPPDFPREILADSKAMSPSARDFAYGQIVARACDWAVGWASCAEIGEINILQASFLAMRRAFGSLAMTADLILVDGDKTPGLSERTVAIVKGDSLVPEIMAASIVAKVARDRVMKRLDAVEPYYGFARHKGYPTLAHREAIKKHGLSQWARPGFTVRL